MPGRRNLARERADYLRDSPERHAAIHLALRSELPHHDRALIGRHAILAYFHDRLSIRRRNGGPLTWRIVNHWRVHHTCPILRGNWRPQRKSSPFSTTYALTAWVLSTFAADDLFQIVSAAESSPPAGSFSTSEQAQSSSRSAA
jgi:hypothetical protein